MAKKKINKIANWFLEEEDKEESSREKEEAVEISFFQILLAGILTIGFLGWNFYSQLAHYLPRSAFSIEKFIEDNIEADYFKENADIRNGDFSKGLRYWNTSDGGETFPESKSKIIADNKEFRSRPYSLKIESLAPASRIFYFKSPKKYIIDNPYSSKSKDTWLGVLPGRKITASLWYKGDILTLYMQCLKKDGSWQGLTQVSGPAVTEWRQLVISGIIPEDGRAICLEITINQAEGTPRPIVWIDDIQFKVE